MKHYIALILVLCICFTLYGCGKSKEATECENLINSIGEVTADSEEAIQAAEKAYAALSDKDKESISEMLPILEDARKTYIFALSRKAYQEINSAYDIIKEFGSDVYKAWNLGVSEPANIQKKGIPFFVDELSLSEEEVKAGLGYGMANGENKVWSNLSDAEKKEYLEKADTFFQVTPNNLVLQYSIYAVPFSYIANGKTEEVQEKLDSAKLAMRELSEKYADYEHYPNLKGYYTTTASYFEFCQKPTGTFEMLETTINDYRNEIREYSNDLDFIFGD